MWSFDLNPYNGICDARQSAIIQHGERYYLQFTTGFEGIDNDVLQLTSGLVDTNLSAGNSDIMTLADVFLHAFYLFESEKCEASHTACWTIAEKCLNELWDNHLDKLPFGKLANTNKFLLMQNAVRS
jgi:hypothetical protein